ncbi:MAG: peptidoglycan DD-metalloendopeptidase family protein [Hyphomicrobiaceae bacterium]
MRINRILWRHGLKPLDVGCAIVALGLTLSVAGCSADVSRFDFPSFSLNGDTEATGALPPEAPQRQTSVYNQRDDDTISGSGYRPPSVTQSQKSVRTSALQEPTPPSYDTRSATSYRPSAAAAASSSNTDNYGKKRPSIGGEITVVRGDTLYGLARRHATTVSDLMQVNNLSSTTLRLGQKLVLPGSAKPDSRRPTRTAALVPRSSPVNKDWSGQYTVVPGDSLYRIARQFGVKSSELQSNNAITDPRRIRPGVVLRVPGSASDARSAAGRVGVGPSTVKSIATKSTPSLPKTPRVIQSTTQPTTVINAKKTRVAALDQGKAGIPTVPVTKTVTPPADTTAKLRWPVTGKVIDGFGRRRDGTHNDGVNVAVPLGTPVVAADEGVVAYAGSELKGYGNLILVRHDNGWVTAYAHNQEIMVKRGDKVKRGQPIAKAGRTGQVDQPQVHFELRKGSKPVDPMPYLSARS